MRIHSYQVCDQTALVAFLTKLSREHPELWLQVVRYEGQPHLQLQVQVPGGYDLEPVDQVALKFGLRPSSL